METKEYEAILELKTNMESKPSEERLLLIEALRVLELALGGISMPIVGQIYKYLEENPWSGTVEYFNPDTHNGECYGN